MYEQVPQPAHLRGRIVHDFAVNGTTPLEQRKIGVATE